MLWWDEDEEAADAAAADASADPAAGGDPAAGDAAPPAPRMPTWAPRPAPAELAALLAFSRHAARNLDHVASWRAVSAFARDHWLADPAGLDVDLLGEFHALRHAAADQLGLVDEAAEARRAWLDWAVANDRPAAVLHARAFAAFAEAEDYADRVPAPAAPADSEIPELAAAARGILDRRPEGRDDYQVGLAATIVGAAATLCRRADLAAALADWARRHAPRAAAGDDRALLEAQIAHSRGDLAAAARLAAAVAEDPRGEPVTATVEARQMLAWLSLEAGHEDEAIRQLRTVAATCLALDFTVAGLRSARLLTALLNGRGDYPAARALATDMLRHTRGMPVNPLTMDLELILARSLFDAGEYAEAGLRATPVAQWSTMTADEERTDAAYTIAAAAATALDEHARAVRLLLEHAGHLRRLGDRPGASAALRQAARTLVAPGAVGPAEVPDLAATMLREIGGAMGRSERDLAEVAAGAARDDLAEDLMVAARDLIDDGWSIADWHDDLAYVYWATGREDLALGHVDTAAAGYLDSGDGVESARALLTGVRCCLDRDDAAGAGRYAERINRLLPAETWAGHPVRDALAELLGEDGATGG